MHNIARYRRYIPYPSWRSRVGGPRPKGISSIQPPKQKANDLQAQSNKVIACRVSSIDDVNAQLTGNGFITGDVIYFGHSGPFTDLITGGTLTIIAVGEGTASNTNIASYNYRQLCNITQGCNIDNYLSKNTKIVINGCKAGADENDEGTGYKISIAQLLANQLARTVTAYVKGMYFSTKDAAHDQHFSVTTQTKKPPDSLPMYLIPEGPRSTSRVQSRSALAESVDEQRLWSMVEEETKSVRKLSAFAMLMLLLLAIPARPQDAQIKERSPKRAVEEFWKLEIEGGRLTPEAARQYFFCSSDTDSLN